MLVLAAKVSGLNSTSFLLNSFLLASFGSFFHTIELLWSIWVSKNSSSSTQSLNGGFKGPLLLPGLLLPGLLHLELLPSSFLPPGLLWKLLSPVTVNIVNMGV